MLAPALGLVAILAQADATASPMTARSVPDVLVGLVEMARSGEGPRVVLHLAGGGKVEGVVVDLAARGLLVRDEAVAVHFVDVADVTAVSVVSPSAAQKLAAPPSRAPSKVDVQKRAEELSRLLGETLGGTPVKVDVTWKGLETAQALALVLAAVEEASAGVLATAGDEAARRDLSRRLKRIRVAESVRAGASFTGDTLEIGVAPAAGAAGRASAWEVRRALGSP